MRIMATDNYTTLEILDKGWNHDISIALILHPKFVNGSIQMKVDISKKYDCWSVDLLPKENIEDGSFILLCLKQESINGH